MLVTLSGMVMLVRLVQLNASCPMLVTPLAIVTLVRLVQSENASAPMLVTLLPESSRWSAGSPLERRFVRCW